MLRPPNIPGLLRIISALLNPGVESTGWKSLPVKYLTQARATWFVTLVSDTAIRIDGYTQEIAAHLQEGCDWVEEHPEETPSRAILIYAWNEHDEGG